MLKRLFLNPILGPALIVVFGILCYANTLEVPFVLDDVESITNNPAIEGLANFTPGGPGFDFAPRRWFGYLTFALNYELGGLDQTGYHLFNIGVHIGSALLVYLLVAQTFRTPLLRGTRLADDARVAAAVAGLLFAVHPVQTQAVTYVVQRLTSLCTLMYLASLVLYVGARLSAETRAQRGGEANKQFQGEGWWQAPLLLFASCVAAVLAMKTKEIAFTLPLAALLYEFSFFKGGWKRRALYLLPLLATLSIIPLAVLGDGGASGEDIVAGSGGRVQTDLPRLHYLFTQFRVIGTYLRLVLLPVNQNLDYDYPVYTSLLQPPVLLSFALLLALLLLALYLYRQNDAESAAGRRLAGFGMLWFFLTLSVESSVIPIVDVIFEHRLYLPMVGLAITAAALVGQALQSATAKAGGEMPLIAVAAAVLVLTVATVQRNRVWQDPITLWSDVARKSPNKARPLYNYGFYVMEAGKPEEAVQVLTKVVGMQPTHADAWHNLGRSYLMLRQAAQALPALQEAVRLKPKMSEARLNLATALLMSNRYQEAASILEQERDQAPGRGDILFNLGLAYLGVGNFSSAKTVLDRLQALDPRLGGNLAAQIQRAGGGQ